MKPIITLSLILIFGVAKAQTYRYYFLDIRATGKMEVAIIPENNIQYDDIDSLVCERSQSDRGKEIVKEKKYSSYSVLFNRLSAEGLEFVEFATVPKAGGATQVIGGPLMTTYMIWRRKMK